MLEDELKAKLLEMMEWFHHFCVVNGLNYYVLGGTMLGALRHKGFIPWDDDIDVGMPRKDYDRMCRLFTPETDPNYFLETPLSKAKDYNYCFCKLYDTRTTLIENTRYKTKRGIFIDIFPLDGMGDTEWESRLHFMFIDYRFKLILSRTTGIRKGRNVFKNVMVHTMQMVPSILMNDKKAIEEVNDLCRSKDFDEVMFGGNPFGAWRYREIMPRAVMGKPTLYQFENIEVYGAENPEIYLTNLYGDWAKLPPIEKRISHHDFIDIDLNRSYLE